VSLCDRLTENDWHFSLKTNIFMLVRIIDWISIWRRQLTRNWPLKWNLFLEIKWWNKTFVELFMFIKSISASLQFQWFRDFGIGLWISALFIDQAGNSLTAHSTVRTIKISWTNRL
jgi:hypothetical protein